MATVDGITVAKALEIEGKNIDTAYIDVNGHLHLVLVNTTDIDTGSTGVTEHALVEATHGATGEIVGTTNTQTLSGKTLTSPVINGGTVNSAALVYPTIASHVNAQHDHGAAVDGGLIDLAANGITGKSQLHFGSISGDPNDFGLLTIAHGAPFSPTNILASVQDTDDALTARKGIVCNVVSDTVGGANFSVRLYRNDTETAHTGICRVTYVCMM